MIDRLLVMINTVRQNKGLTRLESIQPSDDLRRDLELDSLDLAELTVRIENESGIDIFEDGFVNSIGEILIKLGKRPNG
ncbi:MAG: acyl carrier protein [Candidatus Cloacimonetes bacterium HGW-Cloacimonetes-2]|jgi:acyl carrier protein|nr:MAG: acyl carrier protein [Candidatus Cloacimonetes bacterium HGW-Cloacimonetes-2]